MPNCLQLADWPAVVKLSQRIASTLHQVATLVVGVLIYIVLRIACKHCIGGCSAGSITPQLYAACSMLQKQSWTPRRSDIYQQQLFQRCRSKAPHKPLVTPPASSSRDATAAEHKVGQADQGPRCSQCKVEIPVLQLPKTAGAALALLHSN